MADMSEGKHTPLSLAASRTPPRFEVRACFNCIDASSPPASCNRCQDCIDEDDRPNWFPKNGADLEYLSWFPPRVAARATGAPTQGGV